MIQFAKLSKTTIDYVETNTFLFSGCKSKEDMKAVGSLFLTKDREIKSFEHFKNDVCNFLTDYSDSTLSKDYNLLMDLVLMHERWHNFTIDDNNRYFLQYRIPIDTCTPTEFLSLNRITLKMDDPFWRAFFPPNGYNLRETVIQVRSKNNYLSDSAASIDLASSITANLFRFNCGCDSFPVDKFINK